MRAFFDEISTDITAAISADMERVSKEIGDEKIYSVALVTDSDCITVYLAINTEEAFEVFKKTSMEDLKDMFPADKLEKLVDNSRWSTGEWKYSDGSGSELNKVSQKLYDMEEMDSAQYEQGKAFFFEAMTNALKNSIEAKVFGENVEDITFFISIADDENTIAIENYSAEQLNSVVNYEKFEKRFE